MTALLEALRRIETQRPVRSSAPIAPPPESPAAPVIPPPHAGGPSVVAEPSVAAEPIVAAATIRLPPRREVPRFNEQSEPPLSARATVADDVAAAAAAIVHRFRAPALVAIVTCGALEADVEIIEAIASAIEARGFAVRCGGVETISDRPVTEERRDKRGYQLLHTTSPEAPEHTPVLGSADGVVLLVELHRTPIQEAEAIVGRLRREAVAVSGILVID